MLWLKAKVFLILTCFVLKANKEVLDSYQVAQDYGGATDFPIFMKTSESYSFSSLNICKLAISMDIGL